MSLPEIVRDYIRDELEGTYTSVMVIVEDVDEENRRVEVSHKDDDRVLPNNVPIASPYAGDGYGIIHPIEPGDEGIVWCLKDPIDEMLQERGHTQETTKQRQHDLDDAVFCPRIWFDEDDVPPHDPGDYLISHESGTLMWIKEDGTYHVDHPSGMELEIGDHTNREGSRLTINDGDGTAIDLDSNPEPYGPLENDHNIEWPANHLQIRHASGIGLTVTDDGINISTIDDGQYQERPEDTVNSHGHQTDPHRIEMQDHRHLVPDESGSSYLLSGPALNHRLLFDVLLGTGINADIANIDIDPYVDLADYYQEYLNWLQSETGQSLDPTMPRDSNGYPDYDADNWLDVEPIPPPDEKDGWWPN